MMEGYNMGGGENVDPLYEKEIDYPSTVNDDISAKEKDPLAFETDFTNIKKEIEEEEYETVIHDENIMGSSNDDKDLRGMNSTMETVKTEEIFIKVEREEDFEEEFEESVVEDGGVDRKCQIPEVSCVSSDVANNPYEYDHCVEQEEKGQHSIALPHPIKEEREQNIPEQEEDERFMHNQVLETSRVTCNTVNGYSEHECENGEVESNNLLLSQLVKDKSDGIDVSDCNQTELALQSDGLKSQSGSFNDCTGTLKSFPDSEKKLTCSYCYKTFKFPCLLSKHVRNHTNERLFSCEICTKSFVDVQYLRAHMRVHTEEKPFSCEFCNKSFGQSGDLTRHQRTHTNEKPFLCEVCKKSFSQSCSLKRHLCTHTNKKPFSCKFCTRSFCQSSSLKIHMRSHTNEKPFICVICEKSFATSTYLKSHLRIHGNK